MYLIKFYSMDIRCWIFNENGLTVIKEMDIRLFYNIQCVYKMKMDLRLLDTHTLCVCTVYILWNNMISSHKLVNRTAFGFLNLWILRIILFFFYFFWLIVSNQKQSSSNPCRLHKMTVDFFKRELSFKSWKLTCSNCTILPMQFIAWIISYHMLWNP